MEMHAFSPTLKRQRQVELWVQGQTGLQSEFQASQVYTEKPCLKKTKNKKIENAASSVVTSIQKMLTFLKIEFSKLLY